MSQDNFNSRAGIRERPEVDDIVRAMRKHARRGEPSETLEKVRELERETGSSLAFDPGDDAIFKTLSRLKGAFWSIGIEHRPGEECDWTDPSRVFCFHIIPLVRAASSSGNIELLEALEGHGIPVGAMNWSMVVGPAITQTKEDALVWVKDKDLDFTGVDPAYSRTFAVNQWHDMNRPPLLLATQRGWQQGLAIMLENKTSLDDLWVRSKGTRPDAFRETWLPAKAPSENLAMWLLARAEGAITSKNEGRIRREIKETIDSVQQGHWMRSGKLLEVVNSMVLRQRMESSVGQVDAAPRRSVPRM